MVGSEPFSEAKYPMLLSTERACDDYRAEWQLLHAHGNISPTLPVLNRSGNTLMGSWIQGVQALQEFRIDEGGGKAIGGEYGFI